MLDSYSIQHHVHDTKIVDRHIIEHRAPTDKSVELLQEMQEKAKASIIETFDLGDNLLSARVIISRQCLQQKLQVLVRYKLNFREFETTFDIKEHEFITCNSTWQQNELFIKRLASHLSKELSKHICANALGSNFDITNSSFTRDDSAFANMTDSKMAELDAEVKFQTLQKWVSQTKDRASAELLIEKIKSAWWNQ